MAIPIQRPLYDESYGVTSGSTTITAGFTVAVPMVGRGEITDVYITPIDGTGTTSGSATLTINVENGVATATATVNPAGTGFASVVSGFSPRLFVLDGDTVKLTLGTGLVSGAAASMSMVVRQRSA